MNNKSVFYFAKEKYDRVVGYVELYTCLMMYQTNEEEWKAVRKAVKDVAEFDDDRRNAASFFSLIDDKFEIKQILVEIIPEGKYAVFEDERPMIIRDMDIIQTSLFEYYTENFCNEGF